MTAVDPDSIYDNFEPWSLKKFLNLSGVRCPLAFVRCKQALLNLEPEQSLKVLLSDTASLTDIRHWAHEHHWDCHLHTEQGQMLLELNRKSEPK